MLDYKLGKHSSGLPSSPNSLLVLGSTIGVLCSCHGFQETCESVRAILGPAGACQGLWKGLQAICSCLQCTVIQDLSWGLQRGKSPGSPQSPATATVGETKTCLGIGRMAGRFQPQTSIQGPSLEGKAGTPAEISVGSKRVDPQQRHSRQETNWCTDAR